VSLAKIVSHGHWKQKQACFVGLLVALLLLLCCLSACGPSAGVLGGGNWQASGLTNTQMQTLAVRAGTPTTIYAANEQGHVFVSTDSGQHWSEHSSGLPLPDPIHQLATSLNGQQLYAATDKGLFVSSSAVNSWQAVSGLPADRYTALDFSVNHLSTIYVGTAQHGVLVTTNNGRSWTPAGSGLPSQPINDLVVDTDAGHIWCVESAGVYRLDNQSRTWHSLNTGLPSGIAINTILPASLVGGQANLIYLGTSRGFFLSQDTGAHWTRGQVPLSGTAVHAILIDVRNSSLKTLYLATDAGALSSTDGGQNWGLIAKGLPANQPIKTLALGGDNDAQLFAVAGTVYLYPGTSGGIAPERIVPFLIILAFFAGLLRFSMRGRKRRPRAAPPNSTTS
jgi:photosystem II stability/assembly factor-like uncharacterized protein